ncbi:MAG: hypothetical protein ACI4JN_04045 [Ruminococcus sp.]
MNSNSRRFVYICIPEETEKREANRYCMYAFRKGVVPISPAYLMPRFLREEQGDREKAEEKFSFYRNLCSEVWIFGKILTPGMKSDVLAARKNKMKIRFIGGRI